MRASSPLLAFAFLSLIAVMGCRELDRPTAESVLRTNLRTMRDLVDQYRGDRGTYPPTLAALVEAGYVRMVPYDPLTQRDDTWIEIREIAKDGAPAGIVNVRSGAAGNAIDGSKYADW